LLGSGFVDRSLSSSCAVVAVLSEKAEAAERMEGGGSMRGVKLRPGASCRWNPPLGFLIRLK
jgi:hypothetical protein